MITRFGTAPRRIGLNIDEFQAHWRGQHGRLAAQLPGMGLYWQNHAILRGGEPLLPWPGFDACSQMEFDSPQTMAAAFASDHARTDLRTDEEYLVDKSKGGFMVTGRAKTEGRIDVGGVRLLTFMRTAPQHRFADLEAGLSALATPSTVIGREIFLSLDGTQAGQIASMFDAVEILWFETPDQAEHHVRSTEARERLHGIAELVRGTERLIARVHVIV